MADKEGRPVDNKILELINERDRLFEVINDYKYVHTNWHCINVLFQNTNKQPLAILSAKAAAILFAPEMQRDRLATNGLLLRTRYLSCFELYYKSIGDVENCYIYSKRLVEHRKTVETQQPNTYTDPMATYFNFMVACYNYEKWQEMETYLHLLKTVECKTIEQQIRQFHNYFYCGLMLYLATQNYAQARVLVTEYEQGIAKYGAQVRLDFTIVIASLCGLTAFFEGKHAEALDWWNPIIDQPKNATEMRTQGAVRLYRLLLWAAQREWLLLESGVRNTRRFLQTANLLTAHEDLLLKQIEAILNADTRHSTASNPNHKTLLQTPIHAETTVFNRFMRVMLSAV